ncbi:MAG TPA: hypothetical protein VFZ00_06040 [Solirubrobacter sp.]|nr:hypothetical protein [Solirubrobacter sp.]
MSAITELREQLREAARREIELERARARRRRRRGAGFLAAVLLGGAAAATATELISVGTPVPEQRTELAPYRATSDGIDLTLTAESGQKYPFGAAIYTAENGKRCIIAGQLRGSQLGIVQNGTFRPFPSRPIDHCGGNGTFVSSRDFGDKTIVYGRAATGARAVRIEGRELPVGRGESFLFVFERVPATHRWNVTAVR